MLIDEQDPGGGVRTLERALHVLDALADLGWSTPTELSRKTGHNRATVYRLLSTLVSAGYAVRRKQDGRYFLAAKVKRLGSCIRNDDIYAQLAGPSLARLVKKIHWPSDFAMLRAGRLTIVDSNYPLSTLTLFPSVLGQTRPMMRSALGRAMLAGMGPIQLAATIDTLQSVSGQDADDLADFGRFSAMIKETRDRGYAIAAGEAIDRIGAIALPVRFEDTVVGAVNVVIFMSAFEADKAAAAYLEPLRACVTEIETTMAVVFPRAPTTALHSER